MEVLNLDTKEKKYNIYIGSDILSNINDYLEGYDKILILSNDTILPIYREKIENIIIDKNKDKEILFYEIKDGEKYKNIETIMEIITFMLENNFSRKSLIISIGGGVVCDMGGFSASIFLRGIDFISIPTSLLSMVDASIGGKTGVNHKLGKNMIGTFNQPQAVFIDICFLKTLSKKEFLSGMGEIIKHGIIIGDKDDNKYLNFLEKNYKEILNLEKDYLIEMIRVSCEIKKNIVEEDEKEKGIRAFLNLGHTYSHAVETLYNYENISHGEGVSKGIIFQFLIAEKLGLIDKNYREKIEVIFKNYEIDCGLVYIPTQKLISIIKHDKKSNFDKINFVLKKKDGMEMLSIDEGTLENINENLVKNLLLNNEKRYIKSVIDIGTNSCRLLICEVSEDENKNIKIIKKLHKETRITRLGKFIEEDNSINKDGRDKVIEIIRDYKMISDNYGARLILGFATSATREASNRELFLKEILEETDVNVRCISGEMEAHLTFSGAIGEFDGNIFLFDIGGGSTEIIFGDRENIEFLESFKIGAIRETKTFFKNDNYAKINECVLDLKNRMKEIIKLKDKKFVLVGVAGTVTTNVSVKEKMINYNSEKVHGYLLHKKDLEKNLETFLKLKLEERKKLPGLQPERAESVVSGTIITLTIMDLINKDEIFISEWDNLEGAIFNLI